MAGVASVVVLGGAAVVLRVARGVDVGRAWDVSVMMMVSDDAGAAGVVVAGVVVRFDAARRVRVRVGEPIMPSTSESVLTSSVPETSVVGIGVGVRVPVARALRVREGVAVGSSVPMTPSGTSVLTAASGIDVEAVGVGLFAALFSSRPRTNTNATTLRINASAIPATVSPVRPLP